MRVKVASGFGRCHLRQQHALLPASVLCREPQLARIGLAHRNARLRPGDPCLPPVCLAFLEGGELHFPCRVLQLQVAGRNGLFADRDEQVFPLHRRFLEVQDGLHRLPGFCRLYQLIRQPQVQRAEAGANGVPGCKQPRAGNRPKPCRA